MKEINTSETIQVYHKDDELKKEFKTLYQYLLYVSGGDFSQFDDMVEIYRAHQEELQIECSTLNILIQKEELKNKDEDLQKVMKSLEDLDPKERVALVIHYNSTSHPDEDEDAFFDDMPPSYDTKIIFGKVRKIVRGNDTSSCIEGIQVNFINYFNDHSDYQYYEAKCKGIEEERWLEPGKVLDQIEKMEFLDSDNFDHKRLLDQIEYEIDNNASILNDLSKTLGLDFSINFVRRYELKSAVESILDKIKMNDSRNSYVWQDADRYVDDYIYKNGVVEDY